LRGQHFLFWLTFPFHKKHVIAGRERLSRDPFLALVRGHLSGFAKGLRKGSRVGQGDVIGYVGATGLATGPHLHYEFRINDVHQNPLRVVMPSAPPITLEYRAAFEAAAQPLALRLQVLRGTNLARLD